MSKETLCVVDGYRVKMDLDFEDMQLLLRLLLAHLAEEQELSKSEWHNASDIVAETLAEILES